MKLVQVVMDAIDWSSYEVLDGPATAFGRNLAEFVANDELARAGEFWQLMENHVFSQDDISSAAEPTVKVLMAALTEDLPSHVRIAVLDLLFHIVHAATLGEDELSGRCLAAVSSRVWLLVREVRRHSGGVQDACLEILDMIHPECAGFVRLAS